MRSDVGVNSDFLGDKGLILTGDFISRGFFRGLLKVRSDGVNSVLRGDKELVLTGDFISSGFFSGLLKIRSDVGVKSAFRGDRVPVLTGDFNRFRFRNGVTGVLLLQEFKFADSLFSCDFSSFFGKTLVTISSLALGLLFSSFSLKCNRTLYGVVGRLCEGKEQETDFSGEGLGDLTCFNGDLVIGF